MKVLHRTRRTEAVQPLDSERFGCPSCGTAVHNVRGERGAYCRSCAALWRVVRCDGCGRDGLLPPEARKYSCHGCGAIGAVR